VCGPPCFCAEFVGFSKKETLDQLLAAITVSACPESGQEAKAQTTGNHGDRGGFGNDRRVDLIIDVARLVPATAIAVDDSTSTQVAYCDSSFALRAPFFVLLPPSSVLPSLFFSGQVRPSSNRVVEYQKNCLRLRTVICKISHQLPAPRHCRCPKPPFRSIN